MADAAPSVALPVDWACRRCRSPIEACANCRLSDRSYIGCDYHGYCSECADALGNELARWTS